MEEHQQGAQDRIRADLSTMLAQQSGVIESVVANVRELVQRDEDSTNRVMSEALDKNSKFSEACTAELHLFLQTASARPDFSKTMLSM